MRLGFCIKMCIENALDLRTIDLQLLRSLDFTRRKFFYPFGGIRKMQSTMNFFLKMKLSILKNIAISLIEIERCHNRKTAKIGEPTKSSRQCKTACCIDYKKKAITVETFYRIFCTPNLIIFGLLFVSVIKKILSMINDSNP